MAVSSAVQAFPVPLAAYEATMRTPVVTLLVVGLVRDAHAPQGQSPAIVLVWIGLAVIIGVNTVGIVSSRRTRAKRDRIHRL